MLCRPEGARASERLGMGYAAKWGARRMRISQIRTHAPAGLERSPKSGMTIAITPSASTLRGNWRPGEPAMRFT